MLLAEGRIPRSISLEAALRNGWPANDNLWMDGWTLFFIIVGVLILVALLNDSVSRTDDEAQREIELESRRPASSADNHELWLFVLGRVYQKAGKSVSEGVMYYNFVDELAAEETDVGGRHYVRRGLDELEKRGCVKIEEITAPTTEGVDPAEVIDYKIVVTREGEQRYQWRRLVDPDPTVESSTTNQFNISNGGDLQAFLNIDSLANRFEVGDTHYSSNHIDHSTVNSTWDAASVADLVEALQPVIANIESQQDPMTRSAVEGQLEEIRKAIAAENQLQLRAAVHGLYSLAVGLGGEAWSRIIRVASKFT